MAGLLSLTYGLWESTTSHNQSQGTFSIYFETAGSAGYLFLKSGGVSRVPFSKCGVSEIIYLGRFRPNISGVRSLYLFSNLEMDAYTMTVSHPSHTIDNPQRTISLEGQNVAVDFIAVPVPTLNLLFNPTSVNIGSIVSVPWAYRNIANTGTVRLELYRGGAWQTLSASVPILAGNIQWPVTGPSDEQAKIRITLNGNSSVTNESMFSITPGLYPPTAICKDVFVTAGSGCTATASIDNGSFDLAGGSITLSQSPSGPYSLGSTPVTLTVTGSNGGSSQCIL